jgi:Fe-S-cluster containining protein
MADKPWYKEGLRFKCTACGDCCTGAPGFVWVNKEEMEALAAAAGVEVV